MSANVHTPVIWFRSLGSPNGFLNITETLVIQCNVLVFSLIKMQDLSVIGSNDTVIQFGLKGVPD